MKKILSMRMDQELMALAALAVKNLGYPTATKTDIVNSALDCLVTLMRKAGVIEHQRLNQAECEAVMDMVLGSRPAPPVDVADHATEEFVDITQQIQSMMKGGGTVGENRSQGSPSGN